MKVINTYIRGVVSRVASCTYVDIYWRPALADWTMFPETPHTTRQTVLNLFILSWAHVVLFDLNCYDLLYGNTGESIKLWVWDNGCLICRLEYNIATVFCLFLGPNFIYESTAKSFCDWKYSKRSDDVNA